METIDILRLENEAAAEIDKEIADKAKKALVSKYRELAAAKQIVRNIEAEIEDLKASFGDGSFTG